MTQAPVLRDIHLPSEPSWWPPAPGWWLLAALVLIVLGVAWRGWAKRRHRLRLRKVLGDELAALRRDHPDAAAQVAAMSLLLRRAAKRYAPQALTLRDEAWLAFLDAGDPVQPFSRGAGRLLLDGPYRRAVDEAQAEALAAIVARRLDGFVTASNGRQAQDSRASPNEQRARA